MDTTEKHTAHHAEHKDIDGQITPPDTEVIEYDEKSAKKLIRRIDRRLLPILGALYSIALIDRVNVSNNTLLQTSRLTAQRYQQHESPAWTKHLDYRLVKDIPFVWLSSFLRICSSKCHPILFYEKLALQNGCLSSLSRGGRSC